MIFVDTNYFLRFLLQDNEKHFIQANRLLAEGTQGKLKLFTSTVVFFEVHWVLRSYYEKNRTQIFETLREILDLEFIQIEDRSILQSALEMFSKKALSLEDCYNLAFAKDKKAVDFKTFDIKLYKVFKEKY
ncbi:MAG: hypothetical protein A2Z11_01325 [Candidatus Woykebacteria bacterium RBG_16_43_9]|uniref:PIN domain-containing protein n=1 Tax=Candidatus Woykebacteria bacterium RBG_16_43_9 TaxID=1802596 RepID=A0A1G1WBQ7_9BACT|nr:MAG: hypothetical protein A2Z11_01325 [Candidatus Woykebacteria bacterium RBG_16_43_9]